MIDNITNDFKSASFLNNTNLYEVNIRQYSIEGTFNAFAEHLPRLKDMGVEVLWLMPIHPIGKINRKGTLGSYYSISNHFAINPEFGTLEDFKNLVTKVHNLGMKIIIDWVANHAAWDNIWTATNPDFFLHDEQGNFKNAFDWDDVIQINHQNVEQQTAMTNAMQYWVTECNIDGFRADLAHLTPLPFWINARIHLQQIKPNLIWLAETEDLDYHQAFDISYTWKWMHTAELFCQKQNTLVDCFNVLMWQRNYFPNNALRLFFTSNHDENSWNGTEYEKYGIFAKNLAVFSSTYTGIPLIYSGQELPNYKRLQFFDKDIIEWRPINDLHSFYRTLYSLRKRNSVYATDNEVNFFADLLSKNILGYTLKNNTDDVVIFLNFSENSVSENVSFFNKNIVYKNIFTSENIIINGEYHLNIEPASCIILEKIA